MEKKQQEAFIEILQLGKTAHGRMKMINAVNNDPSLDPQIRNLYITILKAAPIPLIARLN